MLNSIWLLWYKEVTSIPILYVKAGVLNLLTPGPKKLEKRNFSGPMCLVFTGSYHFQYMSKISIFVFKFQVMTKKKVSTFIRYPILPNLFFTTKNSVRIYDFNTFSQNLCVAHWLRTSAFKNITESLRKVNKKLAILIL